MPCSTFLGGGGGGIDKIEGGEGVECCVFLITRRHINFDVDVPRSAASREPCPGNAGIRRLQMNVGRRGAHTDGYGASLGGPKNS